MVLIHLHPNALLNVISCFLAFLAMYAHLEAQGQSKFGRQNIRGEKWAEVRTGLWWRIVQRGLLLWAELYENSQLTTRCLRG